MSMSVRAMPLYYECQRCTACCRWPGQVRLSDEEVTRLAAFQRLSEFDFVQRFARVRHDRRGLALQEKPNGECVFFHEGDCAVQPVKPQQCRDFPNLWRTPGFHTDCRAVAQEVGVQEYLELLSRATGRPSGDLEKLIQASDQRGAPGQA